MIEDEDDKLEPKIFKDRFFPDVYGDTLDEIDMNGRFGVDKRIDDKALGNKSFEYISTIQTSNF